VMIRVKRSEYVNKRKRKGKGTLLNINIITTSDEVLYGVLWSR
jgi:hypothetical protein